MKPIKVLPHTPIAIGAAAIFKYDLNILEQCERIDRFDEPYSLARVIGADVKRILVPRNMAVGGADLTCEGMDVSFTSKFVPRSEEQTRIITETVQLLAHGHSFVVEAATGIGKTAMAMDVIAKMGKKTIVVVTKEDIRDQWRVAAEQFLGITDGANGSVGYIQGDACQVSGKKLVIAMVHSLAKEARYNEALFKEFGLMVVDECIAQGESVLMGDGKTYVPIEVLAQGFINSRKAPKIMSYNQRADRWEPRTITWAWESGEKDILEIQLDTGNVLRCTEDHLVCTSNRGWVTAISLQPEDDLVLY